MDRGELGRFLFTDERFDRCHAALAVLLGLHGLGSARPAPPNIEGPALPTPCDGPWVTFMSATVRRIGAEVAASETLEAALDALVAGVSGATRQRRWSPLGRLGARSVAAGQNSRSSPMNGWQLRPAFGIGS